MHKLKKLLTVTYIAGSFTILYNRTTARHYFLFSQFSSSIFNFHSRFQFY